MGDRLSIESEAGTVVRSPQLGPYQWENEALHRLFGDRLNGDMWAEIEVPVTTVKIRTVAVNKYAKRLGVTDAELKRCYFRAESKQDLEFYPPQALTEQLEKSVEAVIASGEREREE
jgi:hypothetical protein